MRRTSVECTIVSLAQRKFTVSYCKYCKQMRIPPRLDSGGGRICETGSWAKYVGLRIPCLGEQFQKHWFLSAWVDTLRWLSDAFARWWLDSLTVKSYFIVIIHIRYRKWTRVNHAYQVRDPCLCNVRLFGCAGFAIISLNFGAVSE